MRQVRAYMKTTASTADPEQTLLLLFSEALKSIRSGMDLIGKGSRNEAARTLLKASEIVSVLEGSLDHKIAPELCTNLGDIYVFAVDRLSRSAMNLDASLAREAMEVLEPVSNAFSQVINETGR